jgi:hypothetical protein
MMDFINWFRGWFNRTPYPKKNAIRRFKAINPDSKKLEYYTFRERQIFWKTKHSPDFSVPNRYHEKAYKRAAWGVPTHALKQRARRNYLSTIITPRGFEDYGDNLILFCDDSSTKILSGTVFVGKKPGVPAHFFYRSDPNDKRVVFFYKNGLNYWSGWKFNSGQYNTLMKYKYLQIA